MEKLPLPLDNPMEAPSNHFETLMIDCLRMNSFNKTKSIEEFTKMCTMQGQKTPGWVRPLAFKMYNQAMKAMGATNVLTMMATELTGNLMLASEVALAQALETKQFDQFLAIVNLQLKATGLDKQQQVIHQQNTNVNMLSGANLRERLEELQRKHANITGAGSTLPGGVGVPTLPGGNGQDSQGESPSTISVRVSQ